MQDVLPLVFILDDEPDVLRALDRLLRSAGYPTRVFSSADALLSAQGLQSPGCVILDFDLATHDADGLSVQAALASVGCLRPVIFLSGRANIPTSVAALRAGAVDFLTKPVDERRLFDAVQEALRVDGQNRRARKTLSMLDDRLASLTRREREVLEHVVCGQLNKQIAADLGTHEKTIKVHRGRVMHKIGARSVAELVQLAGVAGIVPREIRGVMLRLDRRAQIRLGESFQKPGPANSERAYAPQAP